MDNIAVCVGHLPLLNAPAHVDQDRRASFAVADQEARLGEVSHRGESGRADDRVQQPVCGEDSEEGLSVRTLALHDVRLARWEHLVGKLARTAVPSRIGDG